MVPAFLILGDDYYPNTAPEILICLNKVARILDSIYELMFEIVIGRSNMHFHGMLNLGTEGKIRQSTKLTQYVGVT